MPSLEAIGWNNFFEDQVREKTDLVRARISEEHKGLYTLLAECGELLGELSGKLRFAAAGRENLPAVGDWVLIRPRLPGPRATIHRILDRRSRFSRKVAGVETGEQILAANIDTVFLLQSLNRDFNLRRLERYLTMAWESGAQPVVLLTKLDLCHEAHPFLEAVEPIAPGIPAHALSAISGEGMEAIRIYLREGRTAALLGSSGVGKTTLLNRLAGIDLGKVRETRKRDDRGRHTTARRQLFLLPQGGILIDTPGMRELQLWDAGLDRSFADIENLARDCRFRDCTHSAEPGCGVQAALEEGRLDPARFESYRKLGAELRYLARRHDAFSQAQEKKKLKSMFKSYRKMMRNRDLW